MKPTRRLLHYLSGTGNTRRVALWLKDKAERQGIPARASPVEDRESWLTEPEPNELVGILRRMGDGGNAGQLVVRATGTGNRQQSPRRFLSPEPLPKAFARSRVVM